MLLNLIFNFFLIPDAHPIIPIMSSSPLFKTVHCFGWSTTGLISLRYLCSLHFHFSISLPLIHTFNWASFFFSPMRTSTSPRSLPPGPYISVQRSSANIVLPNLRKQKWAQGWSVSHGRSLLWERTKKYEPPKNILENGQYWKRNNSPSRPKPFCTRSKLGHHLNSCPLTRAQPEGKEAPTGDTQMSSDIVLDTHV